MLKFVIDEDVPRSTATILKSKGYEVLDVRDCGLRGKSDDEIFKFAQEWNIGGITEPSDRVGIS